MEMFPRSIKTTILILLLLVSVSQIYAQDTNSATKVSWQKTQGFPDITATVSGNPNSGWVAISASGYTPNTQSVFAFIKGKYVGEVYGFGNDTPVNVDVSESGNAPQQVKLIAIDSDGHIMCSGLTDINYTSPLSYCILPQVYKPNEPIPFAAYNTGAGNATVSVYGNGGQLVWSQGFTGNTITGSIPANISAEENIIDYITFSSTSGASVNKTTVPKVSPGDIDFDIKALMIMPDEKLFIFDPQVRYKVLKAFVDRGIKVKRFEGSQATWENVARYGQYGFVKYIYILAHGDYNIGEETDNEILRTFVKLADGWTASCKHSEYTSPPSWCEPFNEYTETHIKTWASMGFDRLVFVYSDACYGGRLKIDGTGNLVEGQPGQIGLFDGPHSDLSLALQLNDTYESRAYHGWWDKGWLGAIAQTSYQEWAKDVWLKMGEGKNLNEALNYAISETEDFSDDAAVNNYRLKGQGLLTDIRITSY